MTPASARSRLSPTKAELVRRAVAWVVLALATPVVGCAVVASGAAVAQAAPAVQARVVVIAVPDLRWSDLASMPDLSAYAAQSSVGDLSVRGEPVAARCADGSLTFAAGDRADAGGATGCALSADALAIRRERLRNDRYGADIAAFGDALRHAGVTTAAVGPGANLLLADSADQVGTTAPTLAAAVRQAAVVAVVDDGLYVASPADRAAAAHRLDTELATQLAAVPAGATTIVAGTSDAPSGGPNLHVVLIHGGNWRHVELSSGSTHARFVQLVDLAPTILAALQLPTPATMIGRPAHDTSRSAPSAAAFVDTNRKEGAARRVDDPLRIALGVAGMAALVLLAVAWWRRSARWNLAALWLSRLAVGLPLAGFGLQLVPWWKAGLGWYPVMVLAALGVIGGLTWLLRGHRTAGLIAIPALTGLLLVGDQIAGAPLQMSAPLGYLALVAARFHGTGNIGFACLAASALLCAGIAGAALRERGHTRAGVVVALAICLVALVVDAAPWWGDDFGGILSFPICIVVLLALLAEVRFTIRRVGLTVLAAVVVAVGFAAADYARPAADRTQIGTFAGEVLHGGAGRTVSRKLSSSLHSFGNVAVTGSVVVLLILAVAYRAEVATILARVPGLRAAATAIASLAVIGTATNDSGVVIAEFALMIGAFAVIGVGVAGPGSAVAGGGPPLSPPAGDVRPPQRREPFPT